MRAGSSFALVFLVSLHLQGCITHAREAPVRKPIQVIIDCIVPNYSMNVMNNKRATSHRDGVNGEVIHQYQVCYEV